MLLNRSVGDIFGVGNDMSLGQSLNASFNRHNSFGFLQAINNQRMQPQPQPQHHQSPIVAISERHDRNLQGK